MRLALAAAVLLAATAGIGHAAETWREPNTGMEFAALPKGCFRMGLPAKAFEETGTLFQKRVRTEMPEHEACVDAFWIGRHEVRVSDWEKVMGSTEGTLGAGAPDTPVAGVTWADAVEFARRLTALSNGSAHFRLPTEAEWEYACRAGAKAVTAIPEREVLNAKAWYSSPYSGHSGYRLTQVQPVGGKAPNAFGLHDMLGNVWEWVQDVYRPDAYARHALYNPIVATPGDTHVIRGGGLRTDQTMTRCETRAWLPVQQRDDTTGLRLVRDK